MIRNQEIEHNRSVGFINRTKWYSEYENQPREKCFTVNGETDIQNFYLRDGFLGKENEKGYYCDYCSFVP